MKSNIKKLQERVDCFFGYYYNRHKVYYETVLYYLENTVDKGDYNEIPKDVIDMMIATDTIHHLEIYDKTPVGSLDFYHYDYDELFRIANEELNKY